MISLSLFFLVITYATFKLRLYNNLNAYDITVLSLILFLMNITFTVGRWNEGGDSFIYTDIVSKLSKERIQDSLFMSTIYFGKYADPIFWIINVSFNKIVGFKNSPFILLYILELILIVKLFKNKHYYVILFFLFNPYYLNIHFNALRQGYAIVFYLYFLLIFKNRFLKYLTPFFFHISTAVTLLAVSNIPFFSTTKKRMNRFLIYGMCFLLSPILRNILPKFEVYSVENYSLAPSLIILIFFYEITFKKYTHKKSSFILLMLSIVFWTTPLGSNRLAIITFFTLLPAFKNWSFKKHPNDSIVLLLINVIFLILSPSIKTILNV